MQRKQQKARATRYYSPAERKGKQMLPPDPFRSWLEADVTHVLDVQRIPYRYEPEKLIYVEPSKTRTYTPDLILDNGIIVEIKGRWTAHDRRKMGYVTEQNPDRDIRMLFALDNKISKQSRTRYSDWCRKRNIKYTIGKEVPCEWLEE